MNTMIIMQYNEIKASFEHSIHVVGHTVNVQLYKRLCRFFSRYSLKHIAYKVHKMQFIGIDMSRCGCIVRSTHGLPTTSSSLFVLDQAKFQLHGFY